MIDRATIDRIMDAVNIVDVVSDFVSLRKRGTSYVGLCPFHDDHNPSMKLDKHFPVSWNAVCSWNAGDSADL